MSSGRLSRDVVIVGGGPAGLAAALALSARGRQCTVVEAKRPPIDKACGEGLMPDSLESLERLGVEIPPEAGFSFRGIRFADAEHMVQSRFSGGTGLGVRRTVLHELLVARALQAGVEILFQATVSEHGDKSVVVREISGQSKATEIDYQWLIGADGQSSQVRERAGLGQTSKLERRFGFRQHFRLAPWTDFVEVHWARCGQIYVTPVAKDEICIALCTRDQHLRVKDALKHFPSLKNRLREGAVSSPERGAITTTRKLCRVAGGSVALIGDASGSVDAVTGEGLALSFRQAAALADAISAGDLRLYQSAHERILRLPGCMAELLLVLDRFPRLRERALSVLADSPQSFARLLSVHVGEQSLWQFAFAEAPILSWRWLTT